MVGFLPICIFWGFEQELGFERLGSGSFFNRSWDLICTIRFCFTEDNAATKNGSVPEF